MQFDVDRFHASELDTEKFLADYYVRERPVVISGFAPPDTKTLLRLASSPDAAPGFGFVGTSLESCSGLLETPFLVQGVLDRNDVVKRARPVRLWLQRLGHETLYHYDGNSLQGLNWQIVGAKRWTLISPDTPPRLCPFSYLAMTSKAFRPNPRRHDFCEFETHPGDLLFLPRYWSHAVSSLSDRNANINWVVTPKMPNIEVYVGRRECAVLALRDRLPQLQRFVFYPTSVRNYAEGGLEIFESYVSAATQWQQLKTLAGELAKLSMLPIFRDSVREGAMRLDEQSTMLSEPPS